MFLCTLSSPAQTIDIEQLSGGNTLVRIGADEKSKYLLLPIEEKAPEANVRVICGNDQMRTLNLRLALDKVDYYVPFCLDEWRGRCSHSPLHQCG